MFFLFTFTLVCHDTLWWSHLKVIVTLKLCSIVVEKTGKPRKKCLNWTVMTKALFLKSLSLKIHLVSCCLIDFFFLPLLIIERITFSLAEGVKIISIARFHHDYNSRINFDFSYVHLIIPIRFLVNKKRRTLHKKKKTTNPVDIWWACSIFV